MSWKVSVEASGPNWRCRWRGVHGGGQDVFVYKKDAQERADAQRRDFQRLDAGLSPLPKAPPAVSVGQAVEEYLTYAQKEKGYRTYRNFDLPALTSLRKFIGDATPLYTVDPTQIQNWKHAMPGTTTAAMHFRTVRAFFNYWVRLKRIAESPARYISKPAEGPGGRALTDAELEALLGAAPSPLFKFAAFSLNTMLRIEEVAIFEWGWISDLPGGAWMGRVPWQLRKTRGKVRKDCVFPLNAAARAAMGARLPAGRVFPYPVSTIQHQLAKVRADLKLSTDITFHCFRHTGATRYLRNGHMEDLLDTRLWSDPRSLLRYVHVEPATLVPRFAALKFPLLAPSAPLKTKPAGRVQRRRVANYADSTK